MQHVPKRATQHKDEKVAFNFSEKLFQFTLAKQESKLEILAGNYIALNMD